MRCKLGGIGSINRLFSMLKLGHVRVCRTECKFFLALKILHILAPHIYLASSHCFSACPICLPYTVPHRLPYRTDKYSLTRSFIHSALCHSLRRGTRRSKLSAHPQEVTELMCSVLFRMSLCWEREMLIRENFLPWGNILLLPYLSLSQYLL